MVEVKSILLIRYISGEGKVMKRFNNIEVIMALLLPFLA